MIDPDEQDATGVFKWLVALPCRAEVCDGLDNDCSGAADDGPDGDGDGAAACDCAPADGGTYAIPGEVTGLTIDADARTLRWNSATQAAGSSTLHNVLRGSLRELPVGGGASETCLSVGQAAATLADPAVPIQHEGFWYLVRGRNACGVGTYGASSGGVERISVTCP